MDTGGQANFNNWLALTIGAGGTLPAGTLRANSKASTHALANAGQTLGGDGYIIPNPIGVIDDAVNGINPCRAYYWPNS